MYTEAEVEELLIRLPESLYGGKNSIDLPFEHTPVIIEDTSTQKNGSSGVTGICGMAGCISTKSRLMDVLTKIGTFNDAYLDKLFFGSLEAIPLYINEYKAGAVARWRLKLGK